MTRRQLFRADQKNMLLYAQTEGKEMGRQEGRQELARDIARILLNKGMPEAEVAETTGLSLKQIKEITQPVPRRGRAAAKGGKRPAGRAKS